MHECIKHRKGRSWGHEPEKVACQLPINLRKEETKPAALTNNERRMERNFFFPIGQVVIIFKCQLVLQNSADHSCDLNVPHLIWTYLKRFFLSPIMCINSSRCPFKIFWGFKKSCILKELSMMITNWSTGTENWSREAVNLYLLICCWITFSGC